jgi:transposase
MEFFCGPHVGMDETAICVVDDTGEVVLEVAVVTDPDAIKTALRPYLGRVRPLGHEAGALSPCCMASCSSSACQRCASRHSMCAPH